MPAPGSPAPRAEGVKPGGSCSQPPQTLNVPNLSLPCPTATHPVPQEPPQPRTHPAQPGSPHAHTPRALDPSRPPPELFHVLWSHPAPHSHHTSPEGPISQRGRHLPSASPDAAWRDEERGEPPEARGACPTQEPPQGHSLGVPPPPAAPTTPGHLPVSPGPAALTCL